MLADYEMSKSKLKQENSTISEKLKNYEAVVDARGGAF